MTDDKEQKTRTLTIRLTPQEHDLLGRLAGDLSRGEFSRRRIFDGHYVRIHAPARKPNKTPVAETAVLAQVLAMLGRSEIAPNLKAIADAVRLGALSVSPETEIMLQTASRAILWMKTALMGALGIKES